MDIWKLIFNIISLALDVLLVIAAIINIIWVHNFVSIIEMIYVGVSMFALFWLEVLPFESLREFVNMYARFWTKLIMIVSGISIGIGFIFCICHFGFKGDFEMGDLMQSFRPKT